MQEGSGELSEEQSGSLSKVAVQLENTASCGSEAQVLTCKEIRKEGQGDLCISIYNKDFSTVSANTEADTQATLLLALNIICFTGVCLKCALLAQ